MTEENKENKLSTETGGNKSKKEIQPTLKDRLSLLGILFLEYVLPVLLAGVIVTILFVVFKLWRSDHLLMVILYGISLAVISFVFSFLMDRILTFIRNRYHKRGVKFGKSARSRKIKVIIGGLVLPLILVIGGNYLSIFPNGTPMDYLITESLNMTAVAPPEEIGSVALQTQDPTTKMLSIQVLGGFHSQEALDQLILLVSDDETVITNAEVNKALQEAVAAYGESAVEPLLNIFTNQTLDESVTVGVQENLYEQYFASAFSGLNNDISRSDIEETERETRLDQIQEAQDLLEQSLSDIQTETISIGEARQNFVLLSLLQMNLQENDSVMKFAMETAANPQYSVQIRGEALLLIGKYGSQDDLETLYPYIQSEDLSIQQQALTAVMNLQEKLGLANQSDGPNQ